MSGVSANIGHSSPEAEGEQDNALAYQSGANFMARLRELSDREAQFDESLGGAEVGD